MALTEKIKQTRNYELLAFENDNPSVEEQNIQEQDVINVVVLSEIENCYKKKYHALRITKKYATAELILKINNPLGQRTIKTLSFPENSIDSIEKLCKAFCNVKILNLST